ncbi:MAG: TonB-dependent receptor [Lachnospiraceae bacterium]
MKNLLTLVILLFPALYGWADEENTVKKTTDAHITGHIILKETGEHLPFMTILLKGTNIGTATDETGHFFLKNLPEGKYTLRVQGVGYKSAEKEIVIVRGKTQEVNFEISEDAVMLDGAVVTANRNETDRREAPVIVNVLSPKVFENTNSVCLSQGLNFQPGLRVENNCQNCGFQQVRINGLDGPYSQILIDSRPMCSSLAGVYGLEQIPANMVERVEVLRGGGSALFGSNAIAGTINIITKEPLYNFFQVGHTLSAIDGESFDNVTSFNGAIVNDQRDAGIYLFGMVRDRQAYDHDDDGFSELGKINSTTLGFKTYYKPTHFSKFTLRIPSYQGIPSRRKQFRQTTSRGRRGRTSRSQHSWREPELHTLIKGLQTPLERVLFPPNIGRESYYGAGQDTNAYGKTKDFTVVGGAQYSYDFDNFLFMPSSPRE